MVVSSFVVVVVVGYILRARIVCVSRADIIVQVIGGLQKTKGSLPHHTEFVIFTPVLAEVMQETL
jgi:hypothetical protein